MNTLTIGEVTRRTGVPAATLRYYDEIGLVVPPSRSDAGHRQYDDGSIRRLQFIRRAKELNCTLDEIADLLMAWDGGECGPVQEHLQRLVEEKIATSQERLLEITMLAAELQRAATHLSGHRPAGPCDESCGCASHSDSDSPDEASAPTGVTFVGQSEIACTLRPELMPDRLSEFQELFDKVTGREAIDRGVRLSLDGIEPSDVATLVTAEQQCCAFWEFAVTIDARGLGLEVRGPDGTQQMIDGLFGVGT